MKTCEMTMSKFTFKEVFWKCGRKAKYITPHDKLHGRKLFVCGIHKEMCDKFHKRIGSKERCVPI